MSGCICVNPGGHLATLMCFFFGILCIDSVIGYRGLIEMD